MEIFLCAPSQFLLILERNGKVNIDIRLKVRKKKTLKPAFASLPCLTAARKSELLGLCCNLHPPLLMAVSKNDSDMEIDLIYRSVALQAPLLALTRHYYWCVCIMIC